MTCLHHVCVYMYVSTGWREREQKRGGSGWYFILYPVSLIDHVRVNERGGVGVEKNVLSFSLECEEIHVRGQTGQQENENVAMSFLWTKTWLVPVLHMDVAYLTGCLCAARLTCTSGRGRWITRRCFSGTRACVRLWRGTQCLCSPSPPSRAAASVKTWRNCVSYHNHWVIWLLWLLSLLVIVCLAHACVCVCVCLCVCVCVCVFAYLQSVNVTHEKQG